MGGDGVSDIGAGAGEGVGRMVNGTGLTSGLLQGQEPVGTETHINNKVPFILEVGFESGGGIVGKAPPSASCFRS